MNHPTKSFEVLDDWLPWLETLSPREIVLGLERVQEVLGRLDLGRPQFVIHVAGTNGKGSSVAMLDALLRTDGVRTGCYTSPHVSRYNERICVDGTPATDEQIVAALERVESARGEVPLTYFEFGTLAALVVFDTAATDGWLLEVGMGGRLDAVNAVEPDASLITNISLDHCAWLGDDIESIAREKAGIMRSAKPAVYGSASVPEAIRLAAAELGAQLLIAGGDFDFTARPDCGTTWSWRGQRHEIDGLRRPALAGDVQVGNAAAVLALIEALDMEHLLTREHINEALAGISLQGRFQVIDELWILDVAHNLAAARALKESLRARFASGKVLAVVGMLEDKDVTGFVSELDEQIDAWIAVSVAGPRVASACRLGQEIANATGKPCRIVDDIQEALEIAAEQAAPGDEILVTGSFYVVGPALDWLRSN